jgi:threonine 3-dehydrogenase
MKALVKAKAEKGIWLQDVPVPTIGHNDVLIKIKSTSICGTDAHIYNWDAWAQKTIKVPMTIGHEFMGEIVELGSEVIGLKVGQRVSGEGHITCGYCRKCRAGNQHLCRNTIGLGVNRTGCFAEYLSFPAKNVYPLPDNIPNNIASFLDPLGNAVHTALSFDLVGEDVLITGAGPIGIMAAAICKKVGARFVVITDVNNYRLDLAKKIGDITTVNPQTDSLDDTMKKLGLKEGFDVGLEMSGNAAGFNQMLEHMNHGGKIALLGIPSAPISIDFNHIIFKGLILKGIYGREMFDTWYKMVMLLQSGLNIQPVLTHEISYKDFQKGFDVMATGQSGKVVMHWD